MTGLTPDRIIYDLAAAADPQVSPDGSQIAFTLSQAERGKKRAGSQIGLVGIDGGDLRS